MTKLLYLLDVACLKASARITSLLPEIKAITLDQTPFYAQGGGQPSDKGTISVKERTFAVTAVKKDAEGNILHFLHDDAEGFLQVGEEVECSVDPTIRDLNTRAHSAGHLLDHAVEDLKLPFEVRGAFHFLPGPYVEYAIVDDSIVLDQAYLSALKESLKTAANAIVAEAMPVQVYSGSVNDLSEWRQGLLPAAVKESGSVRLVRFCREGLLPVPCSGTHVTDSALIKPICIKKISHDKEKRTIRVTYLLS
jgi:alanyl-tRNA synthetase